MSLARFIDRFRRRSARKEHRQVLKRYFADGGDYRLRFDYDLSPASVVLDLGGYEGQWASDIYARYRCRVHVFEPVAAFAGNIRERFRRNDDIVVHPIALGGSSRKEVIHVCGASSSVYKAKNATEEIEFVDAARWLTENGIDTVDLMKINIEGGEYDVLERLLDAGHVASIAAIQVQFHNFAPNAVERMDAIQRRLAATHEPTYQYRFVWENWQRKQSGRA